jgi:ABC-type dipeptide/oligopeptide/nickel transport system permease component
MTAGSVLLLAIVILVLNTLVDLAYTLLDPRVRIGSGSAVRA